MEVNINVFTLIIHHDCRPLCRATFRVAVFCNNVASLSSLQGLLQECNELGAEYLFQTDKPYDVSYDTGDKSIQCGRHVDVFKFWLMWKAKVFMHIISVTPLSHSDTAPQTQSNL